MASATVSTYKQVPYRPRRATRADDPPCFWSENNILVINIFQNEIRLVKLNPADEAECELAARERQVALDKIIKNRQLHKAAAIKYKKLHDRGIIPANPNELTVQVPPATESSTSFFGKIAGAAKSTFLRTSEPTAIPTAAHEDENIEVTLYESTEESEAESTLNESRSNERNTSLNVETWIQEAYKRYGLPPPPATQSYEFFLASELAKHLGEYQPGTGPTHVHRIVVLKPSDLTRTQGATQQQIIDNAFSRKRELLLRLGVISADETIRYILQFGEETFDVVEENNPDLINLADQPLQNQPPLETYGAGGHQPPSVADDTGIKVPEITRNGSVLSTTIWPAYYPFDTYTPDSYWHALVQETRDWQLGSSRDDILKDHLLQSIEDTTGRRKIIITRADILQQLRLEPEVQRGQRAQTQTWYRILIFAASRKLKLALEVKAISDPHEEFDVEVVIKFLLNTENDYLETLPDPVDNNEQRNNEEHHEEESEDNQTPIMASVVHLSNVEAAADDLKLIRSHCNDQATKPMDIDDVDHYGDLLRAVEETIKNDMDSILNTKGIADADMKVYYQQKQSMTKERKDLQLLLSKMRTMLQPAQQTPQRPPRAHGTTTLGLKLPTAQIPTFDGEPKNWLTFRDVFNSLIINNPDGTMADVQKFMFLRQSLTGKAQDCIKNIPVTGANFKRAWKTVQDIHSNPQRIKDSYFKDISALRKLQIQSASGLRKIHSTISNAREALADLGVPSADELLIAKLVEAMDETTLNFYIMRQRPQGTSRTDPATWEEVTEFINDRCMALDTIQPSTREERNNMPRRQANVAQPRRNDDRNRPFNPRTLTCHLCKQSHGLWGCEEFRNKPLDQRMELVRNRKLCFNCLSKAHVTKECKSRFSCKTCNRRHHTLLHAPGGHQQGPPPQDSRNRVKTNTVFHGENKHGPTSHQARNEVQANIAAHSSIQTRNTTRQVILPTARVLVKDASNQFGPFRALLDTGSQSNFISEKAVQLLRLKRRRSAVQITGIGNTESASCKGEVTLHIRSRLDPSVNLTIQALILNKVTGDVPGYNVQQDTWTKLQDLMLADPDCLLPGKIDILLGAEVVLASLQGRRHIGGNHEPVAHKTTFGWIVGGTGESITSPRNVSANVAREIPISVLQTFWGAQAPFGEQSNAKSTFNKEEQKCEKLFTSTTRRREDGKLEVQIPFRNHSPNLGQSKDIALKRLAGTEARLARNPDLRKQYESFMEEYEKSGHMTETQVSLGNECYLPHHPIIRTTALTTKLRVVFDASAKTANGNSLNDEQLIGPVIQDDLFAILSRFRLHRIAINGDIEKMYRQIHIAQHQQDYQRILWRRKPEEPVTMFRLNTVTYGTASAPWLATRALNWIADKEETRHPAVARIIREDFYMDDALSGADSPEEAHQLQKQLTTLLQSYGLPLRKWASNDEWVIRSVSGGNELMINPEDIIKTLGLKWCSKEDSFKFKVKLKDFKTLTKREMISEIASTFDPLGFVAPVIVTAKILYQQVWQTKTDWDDPLPEDIAQGYQSFRQKLDKLELITLPRWLGVLSTDAFELHAFTDASEKAYGACVYLRVTGVSGVVTNLVAAKTRVAPLQTVSLPRLELMGAVLGAQLMDQVRRALRRNVPYNYYWSDSTITLAWIQGQPCKYKTFIANRIAAIHELSKPEEWQHVGTKDNPADLCSRGVPPDQLTGTIKQMWFHGPRWLQEGKLPDPKAVSEALEELKKVKSLHVTTTTNLIIEMIERASRFPLLVKRMAWMDRFILNCQRKGDQRNLNPQLSPKELDEAFLKLSYAVQRQEWPSIHTAYEKGLSPTDTKNPVLEAIKKSNIANLAPFRSDSKVLRVGGRLSNRNEEFIQNHPIILPYGHFARIYLQDLHLRTDHAGPTLLLATARQRVWIIRGRQLATEVAKKCVTCTRWQGNTLQQQMGALPKSRTEGFRAFHTIGVDYAGPIAVKTRKGRGAATTKGWICVFVCFATKALHLELVSELTSEGFIAAFRRFIARRGLPTQINSDNGTNFVGGDKELKRLLQEETFQRKLINTALGQGIEFKFIPPSAPHQGGLWEAGVKSVKFHLRRTLGASLLTYEEYATVLCQIEAQLNSRPLCPLTEDPSDLNFLTPGHFLIGQPMNTAPDPNLDEIKENRLGRFQYLQRLQQDFWKKWHQEYLTTLQKRHKWQLPHENIKLDDLVLIKEENLAPTQWRRGRVIALHPGNDNHTRVVTLRTVNGEVSRPIVKLVKLA